jgi:hypothetical protein
MAFKNYGTKKKDNEIKYEVLKVFGKLDSDSKMPKQLRLISWNGKAPVYDLRGWGTDDEGNVTMTKGITMDGEELQSLFDILTEMNEDDDESEVE